MAFLEISDVSLAECDTRRLKGFFLEAPEIGVQSKIPVLEFRGWVLGQQEPPIGVEVVPQGRGNLDHGPHTFPCALNLEKHAGPCDLLDGRKRVAPVDGRRPDVAAEFPGVPGAEQSGFQMRWGVLGLPLAFEIGLRAVFADASTAPLAVVRGRRLRLPSSFVPRMQPLLITMLGRTGATWLMRLLGEHPQILVHPSLHYETRAASYWMHVLKFMAEPSRRFHTDDHPDLAPWFDEIGMRRITQFCQQMLEDTYAHLAKSRGESKFTYFAEKCHPDHIPCLIGELYPAAREVFLIRDPRDMFCTVSASNRKRGSADFGRGPVSTDEDYVAYLRRETQTLLESWKIRSASAHLVRYEDLILDPQQTLFRLFQYLDVDKTRPTIKGVVERASTDTPELPFHRTSSHAQSSIGRWRRDMSPSLQDVSNEAFREVLETFGYELS